MSIEVNHFLKKEKYSVWYHPRRTSNLKPVGLRRGIPAWMPTSSFKFFSNISISFFFQRLRRLILTPNQVFCRFCVRFFCATKCLPIIKVPLVIPAAPLNISIVPWHPRRYQLMCYLTFS